MNNSHVLSFGELLYRLQSVTSNFFTETNSFINVFPAGSEANVAVTLGQLGVKSSYFSAAPNNQLTAEILDVLQAKGVSTESFLLKGERLGSYILLGANGLTNGEVIYDRNYSSFSTFKVGDIDWDTVFNGITWFHWTALTPALNADLALVCLEALRVARSKGVFISVDLNYRSRLWKYGKDPMDVMPELVQYCDLIMGNIWAANKMLGTSIDDAWSGDRNKIDYKEIANDVANEIFNHYKNCKHIAFTFRFMDSAVHNLLYGTYHSADGNFVSRSLETNELVDRIGSGDAFMGGLIAALVMNYSPQETIDFATEIGFKKLFVKGDFITL